MEARAVEDLTFTTIPKGADHDGEDDGNVVWLCVECIKTVEQKLYREKKSKRVSSTVASLHWFKSWAQTRAAPKNS
jgi:hypothetical protein